MADITVVEVPERRRYTVSVDGVHAGFLGYIDRDGSRLLVHTEVGDEWGGQGVGSALVREAIADCRARGVGVVPLCPFVASWLERHPDEGDVVDQAALDRMR